MPEPFVLILAMLWGSLNIRHRLDTSDDQAEGLREAGFVCRFPLIFRVIYDVRSVQKHLT